VISSNKVYSIVSDLDHWTICELDLAANVPWLQDLAIFALPIVQVNCQESALAIVQGFTAADSFFDCVEKVHCFLQG
jgi:hypothetical protein